MSVIEFLKRFFKPSYTLLPEEEKEFSESEILLYAKKRVADVFHLPEDEVALGDVFCQGRLQIHPSPFFNSSELDILNDDLCNAAWDDDQDTVWIKCMVKIVRWSFMKYETIASIWFVVIGIVQREVIKNYCGTGFKTEKRELGV